MSLLIIGSTVDTNFQMDRYGKATLTKQPTRLLPGSEYRPIVILSSISFGYSQEVVILTTRQIAIGMSSLNRNERRILIEQLRNL